MSFTKTFFLGDTEFTVEFSASPYVAAKTWGPPENSHPAEGGDVDIESILVGGFEMLNFLNDETFNALKTKCEECSEECYADQRDSDLADKAEAAADDREADWEN